MSQSTGYRVADFRDAQAEKERLQAQAQLVTGAEHAAFVDLGLPEAGHVLDVGCGPGYVAERLMQARPGLRIVGVDRDPEVLVEAMRRLPARQGEVDALPFVDASFDFAYARVLLRHVTDPVAALREMARVVRPGGGVVVGDTDDGTLVLDPEPPGFAEALAARHESFRRRGADPLVGRRLRACFRAAGVLGVRVRPLPIDSASIGADAFARILLAPLVDAIDADLMSEEEVEAVASAVEKWGRLPEAFGMTTALIVGGWRA